MGLAGLIKIVPMRKHEIIHDKYLQDKKMLHQFRNSIRIYDVEDFNCIGQDMLFAFVDSISEDERYLHDSINLETGERYLNLKAVQMIERYNVRLTKLAKSIIPKDQWDYLDFEPENLITD